MTTCVVGVNDIKLHIWFDQCLCIGFVYPSHRTAVSLRSHAIAVRYNRGDIFAWIERFVPLANGEYFGWHWK